MTGQEKLEEAIVHAEKGDREAAFVAAMEALSAELTEVRTLLDATDGVPLVEAVRQALARSRAEEREACARVCDGVLSSEFCAQRIRART